jgi:hypothetical protein
MIIFLLLLFIYSQFSYSVGHFSVKESIDAVISEQRYGKEKVLVTNGSGLISGTMLSLA